MPLPSEVTDWIARSEVDHIGPFVNAWAAFNAWYRHVSESSQDRDGLNYVRTRPNSVRGAILPMLDPLTDDTADASEFKALIAALHGALEGYRLETECRGKLETISFRSVPTHDSEALPYSYCYSGCTYRIAKANKQWISTVTNRAGAEVVRIEHDDYSERALIDDDQFGSLSVTQQSQLKACYQWCNPRPLADLLNNEEPAIRVGTINFTCTCEDLFGGIVETIYRMRNMLLHGELKPHDAALAC